MPRTGRYTVEFEAAGYRWNVETQHHHGSEVCVHKPQCLRLVGDPKKGQQRLVVRCGAPTFVPFRWAPDLKKPNRTHKLRHLTTVRLIRKGEPAVIGHAPCSVDDVYVWRKGITLALQRCLEKMGLCIMERQDCQHAEMGVPCFHDRPTENCREYDRIVAVDKTPEYREIMEAFWRESSIKAEAAVAPKIIPPIGDSPQDYTGQTHGLGFTGD